MQIVYGFFHRGHCLEDEALAATNRNPGDRTRKAVLKVKEAGQCAQGVCGMMSMARGEGAVERGCPALATERLPCYIRDAGGGGTR